MTQWAQGGTATLSVVIANLSGTPSDCSDLQLSVIDATNTPLAGFPVVSPAIVHDGTGSYHYIWSVPALLAVGTYSAMWSGTVSGGLVAGYEDLEIVSPASLVTGTAVGAYATLSDVRTRLTENGDAPTTNDDALITWLCNQVNGWIESTTGRILAPIPAVSTAVVSGASAGSTTVTIGSVANLNAGDALLFGPVTGTREHKVIAGIAAGNVVMLQSPLVASYAIGEVVVKCHIWDGFDALENGFLLPAPNGIVSMTSLEVATYTSGDFSLIPPTDWFLRPLPLAREPGWPATEIWMTNIPSAANAAPYFMPGFGNVRAVGTMGWPHIPDEIADIALTAAVAAWRGRASQGGDMFTLGVDGERTFYRALSWEQKKTLARYSGKDVAVI